MVAGLINVLPGAGAGSPGWLRTACGADFVAAVALLVPAAGAALLRRGVRV
jgi:hypothetical protein